jgi:predicted nucleic acid-binding protein
MAATETLITETLIDAGPLVALLDRRDEHHAWAVREAGRLDAPFHTCEAVLSEAYVLLERRTHGGSEALTRLLERKRLDASFSYADHAERVHALMRAYADQPMSFADACLVRLSEIRAGSQVFTVDADFRTYRKRGDGEIVVLMP